MTTGQNPQRSLPEPSEPSRAGAGELLDRLVGEYADRLALDPAADPGPLLEQAPPEHRGGLERCLRMMRAGIATGPALGEPLGPGVRLDGFRLVRELGRGGMAVVWLAVQEELEREVALKLLRPALAVEGRHVDRFRREALAIARLDHPHIVRVHAVGEARGHHYIAMEYVPGPSLAQVLEALPPVRERTPSDLARASGAPSLAEAASFEQAFAGLFAPVARAVGLAHELGLVHRDLKPSNILVHPDGRALVGDFGLAKGAGDPGLSLSGEALGTPFYMSPEQATAASERVDHRTDVYSLGVTLYEALTGQRPFEGATLFAVLEAIRSSAPALPRSIAASLSSDAEAVVLRAMEREPADRYPTALDLYADLRALSDGRPTSAGAEGGGDWRRFRRALRQSSRGHPVDFRSRAQFLGVPLVHMHLGRRLPGQKLRVAKGWLAVGEVAVGGLSIGALALGLVPFGGLAAGGICWAGVGLGVVSCAGLALGLFAYGGIAVGYAAFGGLACGVYAIGGMTYGLHTLVDGQPTPELLEFLRGLGRFVPDWLEALMGMRR